MRSFFLFLLTWSTLSAVEIALAPIPGTSITVGVPATWRSDAVNPDSGVTRRFSDSIGEAAMAMSITRLLPNEGPAAFTQRSLADLQQLGLEFDLIDWNFTDTIADRTWSRLHFRITIQRRRWEQELWLTTEPGIGTQPALGVVIVYSAAPATWPTWGPLFRQCLRNPGGSQPSLQP